MNLFQGEFIFLHSGEATDFKIDCDALTDEDIEVIAKQIYKKLAPFSDVYGIPSGGKRLEFALAKYTSENGPLLICDDVLTTGSSFIEAERSFKGCVGVIGVCIFCRNKSKCPEWVYPIFTMW